MGCGPAGSLGRVAPPPPTGSGSEGPVELVGGAGGATTRTNNGCTVSTGLFSPEARGLDVLLRGLSLVRTDDDVLAISGPLFDGLYEYLSRATLLGREPS